MNLAEQNFGYATPVGSSPNPSGAAMLLILQILPQLDIFKRCTEGWKTMADTAKNEAETLRMRLNKHKIQFQQAEEAYNQRIAVLGLRMHKAYDEKLHVKGILLDTAVQLQKLQNQSRMIVANFTSEKENLWKLINEHNTYILNNKQFLKNVSMELTSLVVKNATERDNSTLKNENNFEHEIRRSLEILSKFIQNMKKELTENNRKIKETTESHKKLMEENRKCLASMEEMQEELDEAKEMEEDLKQIKEEKQTLQDINENFLKQILTNVKDIAANHNVTLESIYKQTSSAAKGIQNYIVEPAEEAKNVTLKSILKNRNKEAALISAAKKGNLTEISLLLDYGANIEGEDSSEWRLKPLHWVADQGHWNATRLLLLKGADVNAVSGFLNFTALHVAVNTNQRNVIDLLLKGGADIEARDKFGFTPLFRAVSRDCATAQLLVDRGANINTINDKGITAVSMASDCVRELLCSKGATDPLCRTENETATALPCSLKV